MVAHRRSQGFAQIVDVAHQQVVAVTLREIHREEVATTFNAESLVGSHRDSLAGIRMRLVPAYGPFIEVCHVETPLNLNSKIRLQ